MVMGDCDDDELAFVDATGDDRVAEIGSDSAKGDAGDADAMSGEGFLLSFFEVGIGTEVVAGAGTEVVGVGREEAVAEMGESASCDWAASPRTCKAGAATALVFL
jgi:hypothetical protein